MSYQIEQGIITKFAEVEYEFTNVHCFNHAKKQKKWCKIMVDKTKKVKSIIYDINFNYCVENFNVFCDIRSSTKYRILNTASKIILNDKSVSKITVDNKKIYKIRSGFVTFALLLELNGKTLQYDKKMIGTSSICPLYIIYLSFIYHLSVIYYHLFSIFFFFWFFVKENGEVY